MLFARNISQNINGQENLNHLCLHLSFELSSAHQKHNMCVVKWVYEKRTGRALVNNIN